MGLFNSFEWLRSSKQVRRMLVRMHPKMPKRLSQQNQREERPRKSHGPRPRLRKSSTTPSSLTTNNSKECLKKSQRSFVLPELFSLKSSRLVDQLPEHSSRNLQ